MRQAALFFDIDGTLLSEKTREIPESTLDALGAARKNGHLAFINTGRTYGSLPPETVRMQMDGYLCGCGTYILYQDEVLLENHIPKDRGIEIIDCIKRCNLEGLCEGTEDVYFSNRISRFEQIESMRRYFALEGLGVERAMEEKNFIYDKLLVYTDSRSDKQAFLDFISADMEAIDRGQGIYECVQKRYSKATGIQVIMERLGLEKDQVYVFGDSSNDLSMFEFADHAVAMEVHDAVLEPYTEHVTGKVEEGGISSAMEHYGLI